MPAKLNALRRRLGRALAVVPMVVGIPTLRAAGRSEPGAASTILLGQSTSLSGTFARIGTEYRNGALLYFERLNATGGVRGRSIKLLTLDDGYSIERAIANTKHFVEVEGVQALFGYFGTAVTSACLPISADQRVPLFAPYTGADSLRREANRYLFHIRASYGQEASKIVEHLHTLGIDSVAVAYQADPFGRSGLEGISSASQRLGRKRIIAAELAIFPQVDVAGAVVAIAKANPQVVVLITSGKAAVEFIRRYQQTGLATQFYGTSVVSSNELATELGMSSRGIVISQVLPSPWNGSIPISRAYLTAKEAANDRNPATYGEFEGYVAARTLSEGLRRVAGDFSREAIVNGLESLGELDLGGFRVHFGPGRHLGSSFVDLSIISGNGRFLR